MKENQKNILKNKGEKLKLTTLAFTLIELIGVVVILGILMLLVFPSILNSIRQTENDLTEAGKQILYQSMDLYLEENIMIYPKKEGNHYCVKVADLLNSKKLESIKLVENLKEQDIIEVIVQEGDYHYNLNQECTS